MKKLLMSVVAAVVLATPALAADLKVVTKAPPPPPLSPWDVAFGASLASDYIFRGITQSNHQPSVSAYYEPRYNVNKDLQLYAGIAGSSVVLPNRAAAEIDFYAGIRPTFDKLALDFGAIVLLVSRRAMLQRQPRPGLRHGLRRQRLLAGQRQCHQGRPELLRGVRKGHLHGQRSARVRSRRVLLAIPR